MHMYDHAQTHILVCAHIYMHVYVSHHTWKLYILGTYQQETKKGGKEPVNGYIKEKY